MFVTKVISTNWREAYRNCFGMTLEIYGMAKVDYRQFPSVDEMFLSFLFNMLEYSFEVRANTENMILTSEQQDWVQYAKYAGALFGDLAYFKYDVPPPPEDYLDDSNDAPRDDDVYL